MGGGIGCEVCGKKVALFLLEASGFGVVLGGALCFGLCLGFVEGLGTCFVFWSMFRDLLLCWELLCVLGSVMSFGEVVVLGCVMGLGEVVLGGGLRIEVNA